MSFFGKILGFDQAKKATKAQKKSNRLQRDINRLRNKQAKRDFLRNFRQTQAAQLVGATGAGVDLESSAFQGTLASERTQIQVALGEAAQFDRLGSEITRQSNIAANEQYKSGVASTLSGIALNIATSYIPK